jgi:hypothetical protein
MTIKEQGFVADLVKNKVVYKAVQKNYDTKSKRNASFMGNALLHKPNIQYAILDLMDKSGCSDPALVQRLNHFIHDAKKEVIDPNGAIVELNDNQASLKAMDMAFKIKGAYAPERHEIASVNLNIYQDLTDDELDGKLKFIEAREALVAKGEGTEVGEG